MYAVRFRVPADLANRLGIREFSRSLHTKDANKARERCLAATKWFHETMAKLRSFEALTRSDLESAAAAFFRRWQSELDQPRAFDLEHHDEDVAFSIESSRDRIRDLDRQLVDNVFDGQVTARASSIVEDAGGEFGTLAAEQQLFAQKLSARVEREFMRRLMHELSVPHRTFNVEDALFEATDVPSSSEIASRRRDTGGISLREAVTIYLNRKADRRLSESQVDEIGRVLMWLRERFGDATPVSTVSKAELRTFRDDLGRLNVRLRGQNASFDSRLTNNAERRIKSVTALRYWRSVQSFFAWCEAEDYSDRDPSAGLKLESRKGEAKRTPAAFTTDELKQLLGTPLYAGYKSIKRVTIEGDCHLREGHWWSGVLLMFTGLRGGELSQLLPSDFVFDGELPHLKVRDEDEDGTRLKSIKTAASIRDVPLPATLIKLGIRQFVEQRRKIAPKDRVFREFRLGTKGKKSDGLSKFWANYLRKFDLWKVGRSTHVWRHTFIANLRANGVPEEDIAAVVGHERGTITAGYGGAYPLHRKMENIERLDYGFDVIAALGGQYTGK